MEYVGGGVDYNSGPYTVQFNAGLTTVPFNISIKADNILEDNETFDLSIDASSLPSGVKIGNTGQTIVTIVDDDGQ